MLSADTKVDVMLGLWKNFGLTNIEVSSPVRFFGPKDTSDGSAQSNLRVKWTATKVWWTVGWKVGLECIWKVR